jgi:hypothetical protein
VGSRRLHDIVGGMNDVSGSSQLIGECEESGGLSLCVVE